MEYIVIWTMPLAHLHSDCPHILSSTLSVSNCALAGIWPHWPRCDPVTTSPSNSEGWSSNRLSRTTLKTTLPGRQRHDKPLLLAHSANLTWTQLALEDLLSVKTLTYRKSNLGPRRPIHQTVPHIHLCLSYPLVSGAGATVTPAPAEQRTRQLSLSQTHKRMGS